MNADELWEYEDWKNRNKGGTPEQFLEHQDNIQLAARARYLLSDLELEDYTREVLIGEYDGDIFPQNPTTAEDTPIVARLTGD